MGIGIDISSGMVQKANDQLKKAGCVNLEFHIGNFITPEREFPLDKMKINKIISNYALHHLKLADNYVDQYDQIGYGPGTDLFCYADEL